MIPNFNNYCGGKYHNWLEVFLVDKCNANCAWCIEKGGWHPDNHLSAIELADKIKNCDKENIMLLGGEPTVYEDLGILIENICEYKYTYITTNGKLLTPDFIEKNNLTKLKGVNISIQHYDLNEYKKISGILLNNEVLEDSIVLLRRNNVKVRFNCNIFKGGVDTREKINNYIYWAKCRGAVEIRFNELKGKADNHIKLETLFPELNLSDDPFLDGCMNEFTINNIKIILRQMCGWETEARKKPENPKNINSMEVLYYNGEFYNGWVRNDFSECNSEVQQQLIKKMIKEELNNFK